MTDQNQTNRAQFTPVFDEIRDTLGMNAALVFGAVWRFCQMGTGTCTASQETIAARCCMKRATANRAIAALVGAGYLTKTRTFNGMVLRDAGKIALEKKEPQPIQQADPRQAPDMSELDGEIRQMSDAFVKAAGIQPFRMPEWIKALREMHAAGIRAENVTAAVDKLRSGKYTISGPWSIVKTAISIKASGNQPGKQAGNFGTIRE